LGDDSPVILLLMMMQVIWLVDTCQWAEMQVPTIPVWLDLAMETGGQMNQLALATFSV
jgi:hypothetical protein